MVRTHFFFVYHTCNTQNIIWILLLLIILLVKKLPFTGSKINANFLTGVGWLSFIVKMYYWLHYLALQKAYFLLCLFEADNIWYLGQNISAFHLYSSSASHERKYWKEGKIPLRNPDTSTHPWNINKVRFWKPAIISPLWRVITILLDGTVLWLTRIRAHSYFLPREREGKVPVQTGLLQTAFSPVSGTPSGLLCFAAVSIPSTWFFSGQQLVLS